MGAHDHFDVIVVGTGPGGATVARDLARAGRSVLILERGAAGPIDGSLRRAFRELLSPGVGLLKGDGVSLVRGVGVGGSSLYYYGTAHEPDYGVFDPHGVDLRGDVSAARRDIAIAPLPERLIGPMASSLMGAARELGLDWKPLPKFIDPQLCPSPEPMGFYAAPAGAKWTARKWVEEAVAGGARLETGAQVLRVLHDGRTAQGVVYAQGRATRQAFADRVVVAAGGIGSPQILAASGFDDVGRDFFHDPLVLVTGEVRGARFGAEIPMSAGLHAEQDGYMLTDLSSPPSFFMLNALAGGRPQAMFRHGRTLSIMVKIRDDLAGQVTAKGFRKPLTADDRRRLDVGCGLAEAVLRQAGAGRVARSPIFAAHPGGTVKLGEAVDSDLKTRLDNLYVCDASVIPAPWGIPPTLTILGLGMRLARHLLKAAPATADRRDQAVAA